MLIPDNSLKFFECLRGRYMMLKEKVSMEPEAQESSALGGPIENRKPIFKD